jgi:hypothetical protein
MAKDAPAGKDKKADHKAKDHKPKDAGKPKDAKPKAKAKDKVGAAVAEAPVEAPVKKVEVPRAPADPRLKVLKKFHGKFLPKGVLRERLKSLMERWNSGEDHGNVTVEELKALLDDWRGTQEKPPRLPKS